MLGAAGAAEYGRARALKRAAESAAGAA
jgi:hypothetical protein